MHHSLAFYASYLIGLVVDNAVALVIGGYLGYKYGHVAEAAIAKVFGVLKRI